METLLELTALAIPPDHLYDFVGRGAVVMIFQIGEVNPLVSVTTVDMYSVCPTHYGRDH